MIRTGRYLFSLAVCTAVVLSVALPARAMFFKDDWRWMGSSLDPGPKKQGDPIKLAWSIPPDGTKLTYLRRDPPEINGLNAFLKEKAGPDYMNMFKFIFGRFGAVSGLEFVEVKDDGADVEEANRSVAYKQGDVRVVMSDMSRLDWPGEGWCNIPPRVKCAVVHMTTGHDTSYDMMLKLIMHEVGHAVGFGHQTVFETPDSPNEFRAPNGDYGSMIGFICSAGPQFDDIYGLHRMYGDRLERNGGNDTLKKASDLGKLSPGQDVSIGTDADGIVVKPTQTDFISIDGAADRDNYKFRLTQKAMVTVRLSPRGPTYAFTPDGGQKTVFEASKQNDLLFDLCKESGASLAHASKAGLGEAETVTKVLPAGTYVVIVKGTQDKTQLYRLNVSAEAVTN